MKIQLIGYSGAGKSTLAGQLASQYQYPVLHLDRLHFLAGWKEREGTDVLEQLSYFLTQQDNWIIDGNYSRYHYQRRLEEADLILFLDFPRLICLYRVIKRYLIYRGTSRPSMTEGCSERLDWDFFWWILYRGRNKDRREAFQKICQTFSHKVIILKSQKDINHFLSKQHSTEN